MLRQKLSSFLKPKAYLSSIPIRNISIQREQLVISTDELHGLIREKRADLRILNATWFMPNMNRDAKAEHIEERITRTTKFFDHDKIADLENPLPHSMPDLRRFEECMNEL